MFFSTKSFDAESVKRKSKRSLLREAISRKQKLSCPIFRSGRCFWMVSSISAMALSTIWRISTTWPASNTALCKRTPHSQILLPAQSHHTLSFSSTFSTGYPFGGLRGRGAGADAHISQIAVVPSSFSATSINKTTASGDISLIAETIRVGIPSSSANDICLNSKASSASFITCSRIIPHNASLGGGVIPTMVQCMDGAA
mmetsp:Transcript_7921/g.16768  ORF Transcript_7921/g.16768 Transcript_7921/m.16768 type:complete len:200 (+) Transcript_7921:563-1162(+)